jgi:hypothetical protein
MEMDNVIMGLLDSAATFKRDTSSKLLFVLLNQVDLLLTLVAVSWGLIELNPVISHAIGSPAEILLLKLIIPVIVAYLCPGKLLIPASALLCCVVGWDMKELLVSVL